LASGEENDPQVKEEAWKNLHRLMANADSRDLRCRASSKLEARK